MLIFHEIVKDRKIAIRKAQVCLKRNTVAPDGLEGQGSVEVRGSVEARDGGVRDVPAANYLFISYKVFTLLFYLGLDLTPGHETTQIPNSSLSSKAG